jgi:hypothetical protein
MHDMRETTPDREIESARTELLAEAMAEVGIRARRYVQEPADPAWYDFIDALRRIVGDSQAYDLLRAVEIHSRTTARR